MADFTFSEQKVLSLLPIEEATRKLFAVCTDIFYKGEYVYVLNVDSLFLISDLTPFKLLS